MVELLGSLREAISGLPVLLPLLGGLVAVMLFRRRSASTRPVVRRTVLAAGAVAVAVGLVATLVVGGLAGMFGGGPNYALGLAWGAGIAGLVFLSSLGGAAVLARPANSSRALWGVILGPVVLIAGPLLLGGALGAFSNLLASDQARAERQARTDGLQLVVSSTTTTLRSDGSVASVHVTLSVNATRPYAVNIDPSTGGPTFITGPAGNFSAGYLHHTIPPGAPVAYAAGSSTPYELDFVADSYTSLPPGQWQLVMSFIDFSGLDYELEVPITVRPGG